MDRIHEYIEKALKQKERVIVAIDGKSGSGKTTLAQELAEKYDATVYHMDDFFLQPSQRTPERLSEIGGNVDYERFQREVLTPLLENRSLVYGVFDCKQQKITEYRNTEPTRLQIIEGSYSLHPYFGMPYDISICIDIEAKQQKERIRMRNGDVMLERFLKEWIPKENAYLEKFQISQKCDIYISSLIPSIDSVI